MTPENEQLQTITPTPETPTLDSGEAPADTQEFAEPQAEVDLQFLEGELETATVTKDASRKAFEELMEERRAFGPKMMKVENDLYEANENFFKAQKALNDFKTESE